MLGAGSSIFDTDMLHFIIDCQGYTDSLNKFIFKEVAVLACEANAQPLVFLFKPPYPWIDIQQERKSCNYWLERNYHGLCWDSGHIPYEALQQTLEKALSGTPFIHVKGLQKKNWLSDVLPTKLIYNVENFNCPALHKLPQISDFNCSYYTGVNNYSCAAKNVININDWLFNVSRDEVEE